MPLPVCYFYHISKTAGMSTWQLIEWLYPEDKIRPGRMWEDIIRVPMDVMNPVDRTISHYCHVQRAPEHPFHVEAGTLSLAEFCTHPRTRHMVQNYQAGYLACPGRKIPRELARTMTTADLAAYKTATLA